MDTNTQNAKNHKHWITKEERLRPQIEAVMPLLEDEGFCLIHRALSQFMEHIHAYGRMKCELAAMKNYKKRGNEFNGQYFEGIPTDTDITKVADMSKRKQVTLNNIAGSLAGHYGQVMSLPLPFTSDVDKALKLVEDYLRHMAKKFDKALAISPKEMAKRGMDIPHSFMASTMTLNNLRHCASF